MSAAANVGDAPETRPKKGPTTVYAEPIEDVHQEEQDADDEQEEEDPLQETL